MLPGTFYQDGKRDALQNVADGYVYLDRCIFFATGDNAWYAAAGRGGTDREIMFFNLSGFVSTLVQHGE